MLIEIELYILDAKVINVSKTENYFYIKHVYYNFIKPLQKLFKTINKETKAIKITILYLFSYLFFFFPFEDFELNKI